MGHRMLIDDGNELVSRSLRDTLETVGFEVQVAVGEDTMDVLDQHRIDLVLTERRLLDTDGLSLLWCIKEVYPDLPVVMMTADDTFPVIVEAMRLGAEDYLVEPFDGVTLLNTVQRAIDSGSRGFSGAESRWQDWRDR